MTRASRRLLIAGAFAALAATTLPAAAQNYPSRPVTLIVPWGAGGGTDATARILGSLMEKELGQPVNVVNRTGGSGVVGHAAIASAPALGGRLGGKETGPARNGGHPGGGRRGGGPRGAPRAPRRRLPQGRGGGGDRQEARAGPPRAHCGVVPADRAGERRPRRHPGA